MALAAAAALVNTDRPDRDRLGDPAALDAFVTRWKWTGSRRGDRSELLAVQRLRPRLRRLWQLDEDGVVDEVNAILRDAGALPQLVRHDTWPYHLHATAPGAPLADRMAVEAAMAFVDVVRQGELDRLRVCGAPDCNDVHVDLSRNSSRRYCSPTCANRTNVAAFRSRRATPRVAEHQEAGSRGRGAASHARTASVSAPSPGGGSS
jgi:predicted RNA-binding Zn ribbon-like protein